jgi:hypothetical protein
VNYISVQVNVVTEGREPEKDGWLPKILKEANTSVSSPIVTGNFRVRRRLAFATGKRAHGLHASTQYLNISGEDM